MGKTKLTKYAMVVPVLIALMVGLSAGGCTVVRRVELKTETVSRAVKLKGARSVRAQIRMGAGRLLVEGGADDLMEAELNYSAKAWRPRFDYDVLGGKGVLKVSQGEKRRVLVGADRSKWNLNFNDDVPLKLDVELGAGTSKLRLGTLNLEELNVAGGVGEMAIDLTGAWKRDVDVDIDTGAGSLTLRLPEDFGVRVHVDQGIGEVNADGLTRSGGDYVNDAYSRRKPALDIKIDQGVGEVTLELP